MADLICARTSFLLVVDMQVRLLRAIAGADALLRRAGCLGVPRFLTAHCPDRIGPLEPSLPRADVGDSVIRKVHFNVAAEPGARSKIEAVQRRQAVILGTETHVCVLQSAIGLRQAGFDVFLVTDASGTRKTNDHVQALNRAASCGIQLVTTEMVLFEWLARADTEEFRRHLPIIRDLDRSPANVRTASQN